LQLAKRKCNIEALHPAEHNALSRCFRSTTCR